MPIPARNQNVVVTITRPTRGYGNSTDGSTEIITDARGFRHAGGILGRGGGGTRVRRASAGASEETPDSVFVLDPWPTPGEVRAGDEITWRRLDPKTRKPTGDPFTGTIIRVAENDGFARSRFSHVELGVRGGDGTGV